MAVITVCPGRKLPQVVVERGVICLAASVGAGAYLRVVVGGGTDDAYLIFLARQVAEKARDSPDSVPRGERELLEIVAGRSRGFCALRPSRGARCSEIDLLGLNGGREACNEKCRGTHGGDLYDAILTVADMSRLI